jgi:hypothetical protein
MAPTSGTDTVVTITQAKMTLTFEDLMEFNHSTYDHKALLFEQNEAYREAYLGLQQLNDSDKWYLLCRALLDRDEVGGSLLKNAFSAMPELWIKSALKSAPFSREAVKFLSYIEEDIAISGLASAAARLTRHPTA